MTLHGRATHNGGVARVDTNSILCVLIGLLVIVTRGPMIFAPERTILFYDRLVATDARVRTVALLLGSLAIALLATTVGEEAVSFWLRLLGWLLALVTTWLFVSPRTYRRLVQGVISFVRDSTDAAIVRWIGLAAVVLGTWLVYVGIWVV